MYVYVCVAVQDLIMPIKRPKALFMMEIKTKKIII